jgi:hypothetical protein
MEKKIDTLFIAVFAAQNYHNTRPLTACTNSVKNEIWDSIFALRRSTHLAVLVRDGEVEGREKANT